LRISKNLKLCREESLNLEPPRGAERLERSEAIEHKSRRGELVEPFEPVAVLDAYRVLPSAIAYFIDSPTGYFSA
jgi:hypothetical protein